MRENCLQRKRETAGRLTAALLFGLIATTAFAQDAQQQQPYTETIDVIRHLIIVRVSDSAGNAITDVEPEEFQVTIGGEPAEVESASWIAAGASDPLPAAEAATPEAVPEAQPSSRLIVIFVQTDFARATQRLAGQMKFNAGFVRDLVDSLQPDDLVAVVSHDSHMKLQLDFTIDHDAVAEAVRESIRIRQVPLPEPLTLGPTLAGELDESEMRDAATGEEALLVLARALLSLRGERIVIIAGWGLGELRDGSVAMSEEWSRAMALFQSASIPVITLHTGLEGGQLAGGMKSTSKATGGFFAGTQQFSGQALRRVRGALAGYWELVVRRDETLGPGAHEVEVVVARPGAVLMVAPAIRVRRTSAPAPLNSKRSRSRRKRREARDETV
ncbi:MAG: hypothetical protein KY459_03820 [Acidobacteria bacterium]|nr:hypothetical protein [Acidobacteriota bacterium]